MAKRKREMTEKRIEKLVKEGRGQGVGEEYKPWILIQDVPSKGRATRLKGIKSNRQHEFLSDMERDYFYILEYSNEVIDIREQFPLLPLEETLLIAKELGIKHPEDPKTNEPIVMTTDFLVTIKDNGRGKDVARTIKNTDELMKERTIEKFEIERKYWERREICWGIVTENEINKILAQNISFIHGYNDIGSIDSFINLDKRQVEDLISEYVRRIIYNDKSLRKIANLFDNDFLLKRGTGISIFKHLVIRKLIEVDLFKPLDINKQIEVKLMNDLSMESVM